MVIVFIKNQISKLFILFLQAILDKNFQVFGELTMKDSNQFHAVCLDTYPPCVYMNDTSHGVSALIHKYNDLAGEIRVSLNLVYCKNSP